ncbi:Dicer-like protein 1 [Gryganskiella cystojenkinii]|nr:Dicer-like protein 1 [Gryganskiella cystojenkinii]
MSKKTPNVDLLLWGDDDMALASALPPPLLSTVSNSATLTRASSIVPLVPVPPQTPLAPAPVPTPSQSLVSAPAILGFATASRRTPTSAKTTSQKEDISFWLDPIPHLSQPLLFPKQKPNPSMSTALSTTASSFTSSIPAFIPSSTPLAKPLMTPLSKHSSTKSPPPIAQALPSLTSPSTHVVVVPEPPKDFNMVPRQYQKELFTKARDGNVVAVMDTGSGKTLVAIMLIKEMIDLNNVPLVYQQAAVIRANCGIKVVELSGEKISSKKYKTDLWEKVYEETDVVVLTAQILLDLLRHGFLEMSRIHLLIFDECHHARKDHPFACIMKEFYHSNFDSKDERPKIFGMTASPSSEIGSKLHHSADELEKLLDSKVFTIDQEGVKMYVERPLEIVVQYNSAPEYRKTALTARLQEECGLITKVSDHFTAMNFSLGHLGPWSVDRLWKIYIQKLSSSGSSSSNLDPLAEDCSTAVDIISSWPFQPPICDIRFMTPKVLKLIQLLRVSGKALDDEFCGIIFVQRRDTAIALCLLLQELEEFQDVFRVQVLAGHNENDERVLRMSFHEQNAIISNFRKKVYNLLVATSVAEEGLDIQPCNVVIRFDPANTTISYIQSRGRARKKNSRFIMMQDVDNPTEETSLERLQYGEMIMKEWCHSLSSDRLMRNSTADDEDDDGRDNILNDFAVYQTYRVPSTGALLTLDSAIPLLHYYCSTLSGDEYCSPHPEFDTIMNGESGFVCDLTLPPNAPVRLLQSDRTSTKIMAKKSAAYKACEQLHRLGALNDNLLPVAKDIVKEDEKDQESVDKENKNASYPLNTPKLWQDSPSTPEVLYGSIVELTAKSLENLGGKDRYRTMCLLTRQPLPCVVYPFNLFIEGSARKVTIRAVEAPLHVRNDQIESLRRFTLTTFQRICRKKFDGNLETMPYFVAPLKTGDLGEDFGEMISWTDVEVGQSLTPTEPPEDDGLLNSIVTLRTDNGREFFVHKVVKGYGVRDTMPTDIFRSAIDDWKTADSKAAGAKPSLAEGQSEPTFAAYFQEKFRVTPKDDDIILQVGRIRKMRNNLQPAVREETEKDDPRAHVALPRSHCLRGSITADVLRMCQLLPSILFSLDSTLLAHEVSEEFGLQGIRLDLLQDALTTSSANRDFQYERLELLGDSFLKFSSTIRLYIVNPAKDEGQLHGNRIRIISNKALLGLSKELELYRYACSTPFHRKSWRPTRFVVDGNEWQQEQEHKLSNKTLADLMEAIMGAAYLSGGVAAALSAAKALRIPFDEFESWTTFNEVYLRDRALDSTMVPSPQQMMDLQEVEKTIGYKFKRPELFFEAMTHASHIRTDSVCYQRLEFLGDAVLDFQVIRYYYQKYSTAPPGVITLIKDASVNNQILGAICLRWGLQQHLVHYSPSLVHAIARAAVTLEDKDQTSGEYWNDVTMPKVLGDLVESTLGAVFVDSGFNFEVVSDLFRRLIQPFLDEHVDFASIIVHPNKLLLETLQSLGCQDFKFAHDNSVAPSQNEQILQRLGLHKPMISGVHAEVQEGHSLDVGLPLMACHFQIHGQTMATAKGVHIEDLRKEVAVATLGLLKADPRMLSKLCVCPKKRGPRHESLLNRYQDDERLSGLRSLMEQTNAISSSISPLIAV